MKAIVVLGCILVLINLVVIQGQLPAKLSAG